MASLLVLTDCNKSVRLGDRKERERDYHTVGSADPHHRTNAICTTV